MCEMTSEKKATSKMIYQLSSKMLPNSWKPYF